MCYSFVAVICFREVQSKLGQTAQSGVCFMSQHAVRGVGFPPQTVFGLHSNLFYVRIGQPTISKLHVFVGVKSELSSLSHPHKKCCVRVVCVTANLHSFID